MTYHSIDDGLLYQTKPTYSIPTGHPEKGWTASTLGYLNEAKKWAMVVLRNRKYMRRRYSWVVHVNLNESDFPVDQIGPMWTKVTRKLRDKYGVVGLWVREPNRLNKLHYHILIKNRIGMEELRHAFEESMPPRSYVKWRKRVERIKNHFRLPFYMFKAKLSGRDKKGIYRKDLYRAKRLLFKPNLHFDKVGAIGDFWEPGKNRETLWNEIRAIEERINEGMNHPNNPEVERLAKYIHQYLGGCVRLERIQRSLRYWHRSDGVLKWIEQLAADEWCDDDTGEDDRASEIH